MFKQPYLPNHGKCIVVTPGSMSPGKKLRVREGTRVSSFLEGTATSFSGPPPHDFLGQEFLLAELIADDDKEQKNWDCRDYFPEHFAAARQNVSQTFLYGVVINARLSQMAPSIRSLHKQPRNSIAVKVDSRASCRLKNTCASGNRNLLLRLEKVQFKR